MSEFDEFRAALRTFEDAEQYRNEMVSVTPLEDWDTSEVLKLADANLSDALADLRGLTHPKVLSKLLDILDENAALRRELQEAKTKAYRNAAAFLRIQVNQCELEHVSVPRRIKDCVPRIGAMGAAPDTEAGGQV